ncbi:conserved hypothetical protein [Theileria equi strain WA]|uniref:Immune mapped protein 2 N-terminal domain-containing protein n=1 Tax=Theileria equi strain WA TaxID=1537102 RepID=L1LE07_THEEQ|nr:conserved hypothetical protein [Theileria equi strain WA]EKX73581.1 conserved hypothetical protein [Theileria equi strain WA]|eukprot:XP_004833033.1 conserved hypothetical protein [Theileria equi strain WA]
MNIFVKLCGCCCGDSETEVAITHVIKREEPCVAKPEPEKSSEGARLVVPEEPSTPQEEHIEEEQPNFVAVKKPLKFKKKEIERITITGAVAALPPPPREEIVGDIPRVGPPKSLPKKSGAYLIYSLEDGGSLCIRYAHDAPSSDFAGVLAFVEPGKDISNYHYENNGGKCILSTGVQEYMGSRFQHDRKKYFEAWLAFLQLLKAHSGNLYLLSAFKVSPPPKVLILLYKGGVIVEAPLDQAIHVADYELAAVIPSSLDYKEKLGEDYSRLSFNSMVTKFGALLELS